MAERRVVSHLLRRVTFGPTAAEVDAAERAGLPATLSAVFRSAGGVVELPAIGADPFAALPKGAAREERQKARQRQRAQVQQATRWWLGRLAAAEPPGDEPSSAAHRAVEKLVFFWHGHWATSVRKVRSAALMLGQQQTFRRYGTGDTGPLVRAMLRDPALILWLDGHRNTRRAPNENLARELMELFTLGIGNYTEDDVKAGARALTGWQVDRATGNARLVPRRHDDAVVTLLGQRRAFDVDAYADLLVRQPAHASFLAGRLWLRYASDRPMPAATAARLVAAFGPGRDVTAMLRALCSDPAFAATAGELVKQPMEWLLGAVRQLGIDLTQLDEKEQKQIQRALQSLGQVPLRPPSVGGWSAGTAWLTTSTAQARLKTGQLLAGLAGPAVATLADSAKTDRLDALARLLVVDAWTERTRRALTEAVAEPRRLLALGLATAEYTVH
jgi:uncharacterized protein (DUF1800 family)